MDLTKEKRILKDYENAKEVYSSFGVDLDKVIERFKEIPISLNCWQGDDVKGFEDHGDVISQNVVTGAYPGAARNGDELRQDIDKAVSFVPCKARVNLHSMYAEPKERTPRNELTADDFSKWISWAKERGYGLDFNASFFTHPMVVDGFTLASRDKNVREYWIKAGIGAREISHVIGRELKTPCYNNIWIPDGLKDIPANRLIYRQNYVEALDRILEKKFDKKNVIDVLEGKLFGIGLESFTVGSHDLYIAYAAKNGLGVCIDTGHYHPTETAVDKISALAPILDDILLHITRGVRWDSDHVLIQSDELTALMTEIKRGNFFDKVGLGLDFFDASINRVAAWVIGLRAASKALLEALAEPSHLLEEAEAKGDYTSRLGLMEEIKNLPINSLWNYVCYITNSAIGPSWLDEIRAYEASLNRD